MASHTTPSPTQGETPAQGSSAGKPVASFVQASGLWKQECFISNDEQPRTAPAFSSINLFAKGCLPWSLDTGFMRKYSYSILNFKFIESFSPTCFLRGIKERTCTLQNWSWEFIPTDLPKLQPQVFQTFFQRKQIHREFHVFSIYTLYHITYGEKAVQGTMAPELLLWI